MFRQHHALKYLCAVLQGIVLFVQLKIFFDSNTKECLRLFSWCICFFNSFSKLLVEINTYQLPYAPKTFAFGDPC